MRHQNHVGDTTNVCNIFIDKKNTIEDVVMATVMKKIQNLTKFLSIQATILLFIQPKFFCRNINKDFLPKLLSIANF